MNKLAVTITDISASGGVILVDMQAENCMMSALLIDTPEKPDWLIKGNRMTAVFKENEVSLAKNLAGNISTRNKLPCKITQINRGELISLITMNFFNQTIQSAITTRASDYLNLQTGDEVTALIKANEVALMKTE